VPVCKGRLSLRPRKKAGYLGGTDRYGRGEIANFRRMSERWAFSPGTKPRIRHVSGCLGTLLRGL
jgi:hypothetical protein